MLPDRLDVGELRLAEQQRAARAERSDRDAAGAVESIGGAESDAASQRREHDARHVERADLRDARVGERRLRGRRDHRDAEQILIGGKRGERRQTGGESERRARRSAGQRARAARTDLLDGAGRWSSASRPGRSRPSRRPRAAAPRRRGRRPRSDRPRRAPSGLGVEPGQYAGAARRDGRVDRHDSSAIEHDLLARPRDPGARGRHVVADHAVAGLVERARDPLALRCRSGWRARARARLRRRSRGGHQSGER